MGWARTARRASRAASRSSGTSSTSRWRSADARASATSTVRSCCRAPTRNNRPLDACTAQRGAAGAYAWRMKARKVLILGASYGSLLGVKLALAGHAVKLVCLPQEAALINAEGAIVRMPVKGREGLVEVRSRELPGSITADGPAAVDPNDYDL